MIPPKRTPYSWFYFPRYPHHMKFLMQEWIIHQPSDSWSLPPKNIPWYFMVKCPKTAWLKPLRKNSNERSKRTHAKNTTSTLTSIYFLLLFVFGFSLCFWLLFLVLIFVPVRSSLSLPPPEKSGVFAFFQILSRLFQLAQMFCNFGKFSCRNHHSLVLKLRKAWVTSPWMCASSYRDRSQTLNQYL